MLPPSLKIKVWIYSLKQNNIILPSLEPLGEPVEIQKKLLESEYAKPEEDFLIVVIFRCCQLQVAIPCCSSLFGWQ